MCFRRIWQKIRRKPVEEEAVLPELPVSEYGQKFNREQNILFGIFIVSVLGYLGVQRYLESLLLQLFMHPLLAPGFSWLTVLFFVLLELFFYFRFRLSQVEKTNRFPVIHLIVYLLKGGRLEFHRAIRKATVMQQHKDKSQTIKVDCAFAKGKPFETFLVRTKYSWGEHLVEDAEEEVFIGFLSVRRPVATLSVKEVGHGKDDIPIVRIVDSAIARQDKQMMEMTDADLRESQRAEDKWEAKVWKGKFEMAQMTINTKEALRKDAVAAAEQAKETAREQDDILPEPEAPPPRLSPSAKNILIIILAILLVISFVV